jgi:hypothetical protein
MRLTQFSDLAMRVLIYAAQNPDGRFTIDDVNQVHNVSRGHLMKVVNTLTRSGLLIAHRGGMADQNWHAHPRVFLWRRYWPLRNLILRWQNVCVMRMIAHWWGGANCRMFTAMH